jgi:integrase
MAAPAAAKAREAIGNAPRDPAGPLETCAAAAALLANAGHDTWAIQDWLGHRNIQHTVCYAELSPTRFKNFWRE